MSRVIRRTPETEEASQYSYRDLLRDIIRKKLESSGAQSRRMLSGKMTEEDVADVGLSGVGGMLKVHGTGKLLAGLVKDLGEARNVAKSSGFGERYVANTVNRFFKNHIQALREAMLVPEKEYGRINDIRWSKLEGRAPNIQGEYTPQENIIRLVKSGPEKGTVFHEFTHPRQLMSDLNEVLETGVPERVGASVLVKFEDALRGILSGRIDPDTFYHTVSPIEGHARRMERFDPAKGFSFGDFYKKTLQKELNQAEIGLERLDARKTIRRLWEESL